MAETLSSLIANDHRRLRELVVHLAKDCAAPEFDHDICLSRFRLLRAFHYAQTKGEEYAILGYIEEHDLCNDPDLQCLIFELYEEHDLAELLLKEMGQAEEVTLPWRAKLKVLAEMLNHHMLKEERRFIDVIVKILAKETVDELLTGYIRERDELFTKKNGTKLGHLTLASPT